MRCLSSLEVARPTAMRLMDETQIAQIQRAGELQCELTGNSTNTAGWGIAV